ncbi:hypothetical protein EPO34_04440 [Patescibacteria group bacterium]|nr:MAG: hypothetical protein EPO34_04440 [Patescibacteria group bacterium]
MARLPKELTLGEWMAFERVIVASNMTAEEVKNIVEDPSLFGQMLESYRSFRDSNPFALPVEELINRFRIANEEEGWGYGEETFDALAKSAPELPKGRQTFLTLRIRKGEGEKGVEQTFEMHANRIERVRGFLTRRLDCLKSGKNRLMGHDTDNHKPTVEWAVVDYAKYSTMWYTFTDESLTIVWLYHEHIGHNADHPALQLGGYKLDAEPGEFEKYGHFP